MNILGFDFEFCTHGKDYYEFKQDSVSCSENRHYSVIVTVAIESMRLAQSMT